VYESVQWYSRAWVLVKLRQCRNIANSHLSRILVPGHRCIFVSSVMLSTLLSARFVQTPTSKPLKVDIYPWHCAWLSSSWSILIQWELLLKLYFQEKIQSSPENSDFWATFSWLWWIPFGKKIDYFRWSNCCSRDVVFNQAFSRMSGSGCPGFVC